jgi:N-acetylglucosamine-6-sulfatase
VHKRWLAGGLALVLLAACSSGGSGSSSGSSAPTSTSAATGNATAITGPPNIVFILTDDLSWNLLNPRFAPHIVDLERRGETFTDYFVADSLCCPSRSTIFTGLFPHDTKVVTNLPPNGGYKKFQQEGLENKTFAVALHGAGYSTAMLGKYLNGYGDPKMTAKNSPVPPGWTDWHVSNKTGYREYDYFLNDNGSVHKYSGPHKYGVDVLSAYARSFIKRVKSKPFMVDVSTFAPHAPYTPAIRNAQDFPGLQEPRDPSFNTSNLNPPAWLGHRKPLRPAQVTRIDRGFRKRAQSVEAVDKLVADVESTLAKEHLSGRTYIVFSSDNGYHLGQHRLDRGKQTAFDTDIRVPLIVVGPGVPQGRTVTQVAQNVDLYPTFLDLAGRTPTSAIDGHSLVPLLHPSSRAPAWRTVALVEHHGANNDPSDPDFEGGSSNPTAYEAIRISAEHFPGFKGPVNAVYVEYKDAQHEIEYYDLDTDKYERDNTAKTLTVAQRLALHTTLIALARCHTQAACWSAARPEP